MKRAGAITIALPVWHYDLEEFLSIQMETGDPRKKCFDIQPQLTCSNEFFKQIDEKGKWYCFDPYEVKTKLNIDFNDTDNYQIMVNNKDKLDLVKEYDARYIIKIIIKVIVETGLPYISYIDEINEHNPNKHIGRIPCTNLCTESYSIVNENLWHTCSLSSLNLANIEKDEIEYYSKLCVHLLDNMLDICTYPINESYNHVCQFRTIGIGVMGLADYFAKNGHTYESAYKSLFLSNTFEEICFHTIKKSVELSKERGSYINFTSSEWKNGNQIKKYYKNSNVFVHKWLELQTDIDQYGIRNSQLLSPAPNTTTSLIQGCVAGVLPPYNLLHYDDSTNGLVAVVPPYLSKYPLRYKAYRNYDMLTVIDYIAEMQKWIDTGISFESLMDLRLVDENDNPIITAKYIYDYIIKSWKYKLKANYYWRFIAKQNENDTVIKNDVCESCSG